MFGLLLSAAECEGEPSIMLGRSVNERGDSSLRVGSGKQEIGFGHA